MTSAASRLPDGTVTLLLADVEGSTRHLLRLGERYPAVEERQHALIVDAVLRHRGQLVDTRRDSTLAAFVSAQDALLAAIEAQRALAAEPWPDDEPFRVRIGVHTGEPARTADGYAGLDVHRTARITQAASGGQILLSRTTRDLVAHAIPAELALIDLGDHLLKDLPHPEQLVQVVAPGLESDFPPPRAPGVAAGLPPHRQPLIGRETELEICQQLLLRDGRRLITLTGPGGTGKTSLAVQLASALLPHFDDGVIFVALASIADPTLVPRAVAHALGVQELGNRPLIEVLIDALVGRHSLLILDNFEHLLPAASFVADLLAACPRLQVVVTSRELLRLSVERDVPVPPLALPPPEAVGAMQLAGNDAVKLFVARARQARPNFALSDESAPAVGEICRRLDGLPLALELAAARVRLMPPRALLARLDRRLPILTDGPRDLPARQRTLRDTIGWSYGLLDDAERGLFRLLGVFVGGCTLDALETVVGDGSWLMGVGRSEDPGTSRETAYPAPDTLDALGSLVDKSLVRQAEGVDGEPRFSQLETIREFALDQVEATGEAPEARRRHAEYFLQLAETADPRLIGHDQVDWLNRLEADHGNLVATLAWAREARESGGLTARGMSATEAGLRLAGALHWFWWLGGHVGEGRRWLAEMLAADGNVAGPVRARAHYAAGTLAMIQGAYDEAYRLLDDGAAMAEALGDPVTQGRCLTYRGIVETYFYEAGKLDESRAIATARFSFSLLERTDDVWGKALAASQLGAHARRAGEFDAAEEILRRAVSLARATGERYLLGSCLPKLGNLYLDQGDFAGAEPLYREALAAFREIRERWWTARSLQFLARAAIGQGDHLRAALLLGGADALLEAGGARRIPRERRDYEALTRHAREALGDEVYEQTYGRGREMPLDTLLEVILAAPAGAGAR
jgi:predicted ATPase/class 3 adenylate cyclase